MITNLSLWDFAVNNRYVVHMIILLLEAFQRESPKPPVRSQKTVQYTGKLALRPPRSRDALDSSITLLVPRACMFI